MRRFTLKQDYQGFYKGTIFVGPIFATDTQRPAFYREQDVEDRKDKIYYYASHVTDNPLIFEEIKTEEKQ